MYFLFVIVRRTYATPNCPCTTASWFQRQLKTWWELTLRGSRTTSARHNEEFVSEVVWRTLLLKTEQNRTDIKDNMLNLPVFNSYHIWDSLAEKCPILRHFAINIALMLSLFKSAGWSKEIQLEVYWFSGEWKKRFTDNSFLLYHSCTDWLKFQLVQFLWVFCMFFLNYMQTRIQ